VFIDDRIRRFAGDLLLGAGTLGVSAVIVLGADPVGAAAALAAVQSDVTCATTGTTACLSANNTKSGIGVLGASKTGTDVLGFTTGNGGQSVGGFSKNGQAGQRMAVTSAFAAAHVALPVIPKMNPVQLPMLER
jgi:hypothetical protein